MKRLTAALAFLLICTLPYAAATDTKSQLWLTGDSSLHAYKSTASDVKIEFKFSENKSAYQQLSSGQLQSLNVEIPIKSMHSGKDGLDKNMQKALKAEQYPQIVFRMEKYEVTPSTIQAQQWLIKTTGMLAIAGVEKQVELNGTLSEEETGARIQGTKDLLMTDFGVKPPKILVIKTSNEVRVHYDLRLNAEGMLR